MELFLAFLGVVVLYFARDEVFNFTYIMKNNALVHYVRKSFEELTKVTWPTKNQAVRLTIIVLIFCIIAAFLLGAFDYIFDLGYKYLLDKR